LYKPGKLNKADLLIQLDKKALNQAKKDNCDQVLLPPKNLDHRIVEELKIHQVDLLILLLKDQLVLVDCLLQANQTAQDLKAA
jgi:hypothetical protein